VLKHVKVSVKHVQFHMSLGVKKKMYRLCADLLRLVVSFCGSPSTVVIVNREWNRLGLTTPHVWTHLDLRKSIKDANGTLAIIGRAGKQLRVLRLNINRWTEQEKARLVDRLISQAPERFEYLGVWTPECRTDWMGLSGRLPLGWHLVSRLCLTSLARLTVGWPHQAPSGSLFPRSIVVNGLALHPWLGHRDVEYFECQRCLEIVRLSGVWTSGHTSHCFFCGAYHPLWCSACSNITRVRFPSVCHSVSEISGVRPKLLLL
jgi:hypothetical protein